jgi:LytS/YehU family sensor histidine kinase
MVFCLYIILKEYPQRLTGSALICLVLQETLELAIPAYSQNFLILPIFRRGKWLLASLLYLVQVLTLIFLIPYILNGIGFLFKALLKVQDTVDWRNEHITFSVIAFTIIGTVFKMATDKLILDKQTRENELRHLKGQLNPHFLFNTLNNLYGLSVAESKKLPDLMLKLSDLLRYSLYDTAQDYVPLQKELDYIVNYVELERIRLSDKTRITVDIQGDTREQYIAPLLLIIFIENCFKHFSTPRDKQGFVNISLASRDGRLHMSVNNSLDPAYVPAENRQRKGGLGLKNVKQRLDLIYPYKHTLQITRDPEWFEVNLQIDLN